LSLSLPYFRSRRYLSGVDWLMGAMDYLALRTTGIGSLSQAVLEVDGAIPEGALVSALAQISDRFPLVHGRVARDCFNLAPFWMVPRRARRRTLAVKVVDLPEGAEVEARRLLEDHANRRLNSRFEHLRFLLVHIGASKSMLGMVFDHKLQDAFGAESFLRLIDQTWQGRLAEIAPQVKTTEPAHLDHWMRRFRAGKAVNQRLSELAKRDIAALQMGPPTGAGRVKFLHDKLSAEETEGIRRRAGEETGVPILLPSTAARAVIAMKEAIPNPPLPGSQHLVFTSASTRTAGQEWEGIFFNQLSFLLFSVPEDAPQNASPVAMMLRDEFFDQIRKGMTAAMQDATMLMRICPHWIGSRMMKTFFKGRLCSLYFACLQSSGFAQNTFMGLPVADLIHTPTAFAPPGLNLCMTFFGDHFNLVLSYVEGVMKDEEAVAMMACFKSLLCAPSVPRVSSVFNPC
jgi:hypothetical protein